jgi:hypothetical protein
MHVLRLFNLRLRALLKNKEEEDAAKANAVISRNPDMTIEYSSVS